MEVIGQLFCSEAPDRLHTGRAQFISMELLLLCLSSWSLCGFMLLHSLTRCPDHPSSVCQVLLCSRTLAVNVFLPPSLHIFILSSYLSLTPLSLHCPLSFTCISLLLCHITPPPPAFAVPWSTETNRTDGLRWFPGSAHFNRKQPGIAAGVMCFQGVCRSNSSVLFCKLYMKL